MKLIYEELDDFEYEVDIEEVKLVFLEEAKEAHREYLLSKENPDKYYGVSRKD